MNDALDRLNADMRGNEHFIAAGFNFCKDLMTRYIVDKERATIETSFNFNELKEVFYKQVLSQNQAALEKEKAMREEGVAEEHAKEHDPAPKSEK